MAALGIGAVFNVIAAEPVLTLAMAKMETRVERRLPIVREPAEASKPAPAVPASAAFARETFRGLLDEPSLTLSQSPVRTASLYPFAVVRRPVASGQPVRGWARTSIEPGFGDFDAEKSVRIYGRNGTGWEEPSCGYVKIHVKF